MFQLPPQGRSFTFEKRNRWETVSHQNAYEVSKGSDEQTLRKDNVRRVLPNLSDFFGLAEHCHRRIIAISTVTVERTPERVLASVQHTQVVTLDFVQP